MPDLSGKVALITGASSGIGRETSIYFSQLGAHLSITGRNEDELNATAAECTKTGHKPLVVCADLSKEDDVKRVLHDSVRHYGKLDILVNNAGIVHYGTIETTSLEDFDRVMNINLRAVFLMTHLAVPHLINTKGSIVNVSSVNGIRAFPGVIGYNISKGAVDHMSRCVALELASKQVRCNVVNPGVIVTDIHRRGGLTEEQYAAFLDRCKATHALGRAGHVSEVAKAIAFLASDDASFITGVTLPVDGGRHAMCPR